MTVKHDDNGSRSPETASDALREERTLAALDSSFPTFDSFDVPSGVVRDERAYAAYRRAESILLIWCAAGFILLVFASALWFVL
jgi:hypothetical protein